MRPYFEDAEAGITIYHGDCRDLLPSLATKEVALLLTDPPYGIANDCDYTRFTNSLSQRRNVGSGIIGDDEPFDPRPLLGYKRVILWGANYYAQRLPVGSTLIWLKKRDHQLGTFLSDAEIAWQKGGRGVFVYRHVWHGFDRQTERGKTLHPTQKPVALMAWCIRRANLPPNSLIVDPYMGSGPTIDAARKLGHRVIGIDLEEGYVEIAARRLSQSVLPLEVAPCP